MQTSKSSMYQFLVLLTTLFLTACSQALEPEFSATTPSHIQTPMYAATRIPTNTSQSAITPTTMSLSTQTPETKTATVKPTLPPTFPPLKTSTLSPVLSSTPVPHIIPSSPGLYSFIWQVDYAYQKRVNSSIGAPITLDALNAGSNTKIIGPGDARQLEFANFADYMAYWTLGRPGQLWISDLGYQDPQLIFTDSDEIYPQTDFADRMELIWSPDDLHLIIRVPENPELNLIFHRETASIDPWPYDCDRVALSPYSGELATWCNSDNGDSRFGVIEWGGDIWYSDEGPNQVFLIRHEGYPISWAWSSDGTRIAFYSLDDPDGYLMIADAQGKIIKKIYPGSAYWLAATPEYTVQGFGPSQPPIKWAPDNQSLVIFAVGSSSRPCPTFFVAFLDKEINRLPCWQVIDSLSEKIVWTILDSSDQIVTRVEPNVSPLAFSAPTISPDGKLLMINYAPTGPYRKAILIDLTTNEAFSYNWPATTTMRWSSIP